MAGGGPEALSFEDDPMNTTRFIVVERGDKPGGPLLKNLPSGDDKTSAIFATKHEPGCLVRALSAFSFRGINLNRIESRPIRGKPWEYYFYVDFSGHSEDETTKKAIQDLRHQTEELKILGSYRRGV